MEDTAQHQVLFRIQPPPQLHMNMVKFHQMESTLEARDKSGISSHLPNVSCIHVLCNELLYDIVRNMVEICRWVSIIKFYSKDSLQSFVMLFLSLLLAVMVICRVRQLVSTFKFS